MYILSTACWCLALLLLLQAPTIADLLILDADAAVAAARPSDLELATAADDLRAGKAAALSRALLLLKRLELHGGGSGGGDDVGLLLPVFESLTSAPSVSTTETIGMPGESAEFRLADQPDGSVFLCFNASSGGGGGAAAVDVQLLRAGGGGGGRAQVRVVPYSSAVAGKPLQQLELSIGPLACWDGGRRYACCSLQPGGDDAIVACGQFRVSVAFC